MLETTSVMVVIGVIGFRGGLISQYAGTKLVIKRKMILAGYVGIDIGLVRKRTR